MNKQRALVISCFVLFFSIGVVHAQDIHTTQIAEHDYLYNPGLIGNYHGNSRIQFSTRSQWTNINNAFETYSFFSCLLYTSPSPRDRTRSRMPSSA